MAKKNSGGLGGFLGFMGVVVGLPALLFVVGHLQIVLGVLAVGVVLYVATKWNKPKTIVDVREQLGYGNEEAEENDEEDKRAEREVIHKEIAAAVKNHGEAVKVLMALGRIDGVTSEAERRIVFTFLQRNGERLIEEKHWPYFYGYSAGEWQRQAEIDEIKLFCESLKVRSLDYRIAIAAAAQAIVATGGTPKKSEIIALEAVQELARA